MNKLPKASSAILLTIAVIVSSLIGFFMGKNDRNKSAVIESSLQNFQSSVIHLDKC